LREAADAGVVASAANAVEQTTATSASPIRAG
jgi:hypothetical protein